MVSKWCRSSSIAGLRTVVEFRIDFIPSRLGTCFVYLRGGPSVGGFPHHLSGPDYKVRFLYGT